MDERELEQLAGRLGHEAGDALDVERTVDTVLQRLRAEPKASSARVVWFRRPRVLTGLAAAAVIVLTASIAVTSQLGNGAPERAAALALTELEALSDDELLEVFDSLTVDVPVSEFAAVGLQDLNETQLLELLELMEG
jgi:hypothetical protein